jgi:hypothetical protein
LHLRVWNRQIRYRARDEATLCFERARQKT